MHVSMVRLSSYSARETVGHVNLAERDSHSPRIGRRSVRISIIEILYRRYCYCKQRHALRCPQSGPWQCRSRMVRGTAPQSLRDFALYWSGSVKKYVHY